MNLGDFNESVLILQPTVAGKSATGEDLVAWSTLDSWQVNVQELSGNERLGPSDAPTGVNQYLVTGRHRDDLQPGMRLKWNSDVLEIVSVPKMPRSMWSAVKCVEVDRPEAETPPTAVQESWVAGGGGWIA